MDANGGREQPGNGIFSRKTGKGARKQEGKGAETTKIAKNAKNGLKIDKKRLKTAVLAFLGLEPQLVAFGRA